MKCLSNICCIRRRFSSVSPTITKVISGQDEQAPRRTGSPLGAGLITNSDFFTFSVLPPGISRRSGAGSSRQLFQAHTAVKVLDDCIALTRGFFEAFAVQDLHGAA